jgi:hypothetical protein
MSNILIAEPAAPRGMFEVALEIAERHIEKGDKVYFLNTLKTEFMRGSFGAVPTINAKALDSYRRWRGLNLLSSPGAILLNGRNGGQDGFKLETFESFSKTARPLELLTAVNNTLVSQHRTVSAFPNNLEKAGLLFQDSLQIFRAILRIIEDRNIDRVYVHNGRASPYYAVVLAAKAAGINFSIFEFAPNKDRFLLVDDDLLHRSERYHDEVDSICSAASENEIITAGTNFYSKRFSMSKDILGTYLEKRTVVSPPKEYFNEQRRVVFFTTSEFEYTGDWVSKFGPQVEIVEYLANALGKLGIKLFVRIHPHMENSDDNQMWGALTRNANVILFPAGSNINSYELIQEADCIVTCGSTVGAEAAFLGKKVVLLGRAIYERLGCAIIPSSLNEAIEIIADSNVCAPPNAKLGALRYAYWFMHYGEPYKFVTVPRLSDSLFKGIRLPYWRVPRIFEPLRPLRDRLKDTSARLKRSMTQGSQR